MIKEIPGYPGYLIDDQGQAYSPKGRALKPQTNLGGNVYVCYIVRDDRTHLVPVHKLLALAFLNLPAGYKPEDVLNKGAGSPLVVDHIDGNKYNNAITNLRWVTPYENLNAANRKRQNKAMKGNQNAKGHKGKGSHKRYIYILDGTEYGLRDLIKKLGCTKACITEAFRKNLGLVKMGRLSRYERNR